MIVWIPKTGGETEAARNTKGLDPKCTARPGRLQELPVGLREHPQPGAMPPSSQVSM